MSRRSQRISEINKTWHLRKNSVSSISDDEDETAFFTADSNSTVSSSPSASSKKLDELSEVHGQHKRRKTAQYGSRHPERSKTNSPSVGDLDVYEKFKLSKTYSKKPPNPDNTNRAPKQMIRLSNVLPPLQERVVEIGNDSNNGHPQILRNHLSRKSQEAITSMVISSSDDDSDIDIGDDDPEKNDLHSNILSGLLAARKHKKPKTVVATEHHAIDNDSTTKELEQSTTNPRKSNQVEKIDINDLKRKPQEALSFIELELPTSYDNNIHGTLDFLQTEHIKEEQLAQKEREEEQQRKIRKVAKFEKKLLSFHANGWSTEQELMQIFDSITEAKVLQVREYSKSPLNQAQCERSKVQKKFQVLQKWIAKNSSDTLSILKILTVYALDYEFSKDVRDFRYTPLQITKFVLKQVPFLRSDSADHVPVYQKYFQYISELNEYHQYVILDKNYFLRRKLFQYQYKGNLKQWLQHLRNIILREDGEKDTKARGASLYEFLKFSTIFNLEQLEYMHTFVLRNCGDGFSTNNVENALIIEYLNVYIQKHSVVEGHQGSIFDDDDED